MLEANAIMQRNLERIQATGKIFRSSCSNLWDIYYAGFGEDPKFRDPESSVHNCNTCHSFIKHYGNLVGIDENYDIITLFDGDDVPEEYKKSFADLSAAIKAAPINNVFVETLANLKFMGYQRDTNGNIVHIKKEQETFALGVAFNYKSYTPEEVRAFGVVELNKVYRFDHLCVHLANSFVYKGKESGEALAGKFRTNKSVFQRLIKETKAETLEYVLEGFKSQTLYRAEDNIPKLEKLIRQARVYEELPSSKEDNWLWVNAYDYIPLGSSVRELIKNVEDAGSSQTAKDNAFEAYNRMVDPVNYQKQQRLASERQLREVKEKVTSEYPALLTRRCATLDDIEPELIEHLHNTEEKKASIFDSVPTASKKVQNFDNCPEISYEEFKKVMAGSKTVELYMESRLIPNLVSLVTTDCTEGKAPFKWTKNNFSWSYKGGLAGVSRIAQAVKVKGGKIDSIFRASLIWNDSDTIGNSDLDLHMKDAQGTHIFYATFQGSACPSGIMLDLDTQHPRPNEIAVENIFATRNSVPDGRYEIWVENFSMHSGNRGFKAEIVFKDKVWTFFHRERVDSKGRINLAVLTIKNGDVVDTKLSNDIVDGLSTTTKVWNISTNEFQTVTLACVSPNYWHDEVGVKENFFFLDGCQSDEPVSTFHVEHLNADLAKHRRVLDFLNAKCESTPKQLSGIGFSNSARNYAYFRVDNKRVYKVNF